MNNKSIYSKVCKDVQRHFMAKGYREGDGVINFIPHDALNLGGTEHGEFE